LSQKEIDEFIDTGLKEFYLRPKQIWEMLISIRNVGDLLRKLHGFKAFIDYFAKKIWRALTGKNASQKVNSRYFSRLAEQKLHSLTPLPTTAVFERIETREAQLTS
jgi:hypothetical protein